MVEGRVIGEPVHRATELMLRDVLHFTKAPLESNRTRDYKVVELRLDEIDGVFHGETVVEAVSADRFRFHLSDEKLVELGAELVYARMG
jgi:hypothetical protein